MWAKTPDVVLAERALVEAPNRVCQLVELFLKGRSADTMRAYSGDLEHFARPSAP
jgi:hypothetical protein